MSSKVYPFGEVVGVDVPASSTIAIWSEAPYKVYQRLNFTNHPAVWDLLYEGDADEEYIPGAFAAATLIKIDAGASEVLYQVGTSPRVIEKAAFQHQGAPGVLDATGTLTAAMILSGIVTSTTVAAVTATLDTGAILDAAVDMEIGDSFDWSALATGANAFTVAAAATGHTVVGTMVVATTTSGRFRTRKTAAATFITYRIA
jgi:uncharacterized protein YaiE (UPF0345 family)